MSTPRPGIEMLASALGLVCALALLASPAAGQPAVPRLAQGDGAHPARPAAPDLSVITLRQAVQEAVLRNPNRLRAAHEVTAAGFLRDAADWQRFPTVSVEASTTSNSPRTASAPGQVVRVDQPLWAGGAIDGQIEAARSQLSATELAESDVRQRLAEETAVAYVAWMNAEERLGVARGGVEVLKTLLGYVERRNREGVASAADVSIASARHSQAVAQAADLKGIAERQRAELERLLTFPVREGRPVEVPRIGERLIADLERDYVANSRLVAQRVAEAVRVRAEAAVRRGQMFPRVGVRMEHLRYPNQAGVNLPDSDTRVLLFMQFTPEPGLASYSGYQAAESRIDAALAQIEADRNDARLRARANWADYAAALLQLADIEPQVAALETASASFMRQFEAGRKSWLEVLNTEREKLDAKLSLSRARTQRDQSALRILVNTGAFWPWLESRP